MSIMELGALGEFFGSIFVLVTLIYLAIQIRQTKQSVQSSSHAHGAAAMNQINLHVASDPDLAEIVMRGLSDIESLKPIEWTRFGFYLTSMFHVFQQHYLDAAKGLGDPSLWAGEERAMHELLALPAVEKWWSEFPSLPYTVDFQTRVNALLDSARETDQWANYQTRVTGSD